MSTFFLVRHGATDMMRDRIAGRMPGVHLNATGRAEAEWIAQRLATAGIEAVYSGPLARAQETARPLCERLGVPLEIAAAFDEIDFGAWTNCTFVELDAQPHWQRFNAFRSTTAPPGGELMLAAQARAVQYLDQLRLRHRAAAIVSHGDVIRALVAHFLGLHLDFFQRIEISPGSITILELEDWGARLRLVNETDRLRSKIAT
jgi:broad specificity phosphatase PhoE